MIEWHRGLGGNKAAKDFTSHERSQVGKVFSFRNRLWKRWNALRQRGFDDAQIKGFTVTAYGDLPCVTKYLHAVHADKGGGLNAVAAAVQPPAARGPPQPTEVQVV